MFALNLDSYRFTVGFVMCNPKDYLFWMISSDPIKMENTGYRDYSVLPPSQADIDVRTALMRGCCIFHNASLTVLFTPRISAIPSSK